MSIEQHLGAIFDDRAAAESAVEDLRRLGLSDEHMGVAVSHSDSYMFETDDEVEVTHGLEKGSPSVHLSGPSQA